MKDNKNNEYFKWGLTAIAVIAIALVLYLIFNRLGFIFKGLKTILSTIASVLYGMVMAFLMAPVYDFLGQKLNKAFSSLFPK